MEDKMSETGIVAAPAPVKKKKRSRLVEYLIVTALMGVVIAAAYFQEPLSAFVRLRLWDKDAPGRTVVSFLQAGKRGDKAGADRYMGATSYKPVMRDGKWIGYSMTAMPGTMEYIFDELSPANPKVVSTEFITQGNGAAKVMVPNAKGEAIGYRLEMRDSGWKVVDILGGRPLKR
jgi:hypothetical protein